MEDELKPIPLADLELTSKILELAHSAIRFKQLKKGINETIKIINKGQALCVLLAEDCDPLLLLTSVVKLCEEHSVPYCFLKDQACLGRACGISRPVVCAVLFDNDERGVKDQIEILADKIENLFYS